MEAAVTAALFGAFICAGLMIEALAPHIPSLLGRGGTPGLGPVAGRDAQGQGDSTSEAIILDLEGRMDELEAERDFYRSLVERKREGDASPVERGGP